MSDQSRQKATVFVGGLNNEVNEQTLHDAFIPFGEIVDVSLPKPDLSVLLSRTFCSNMLIIYPRKSNTDPHRGFGYVEFALPEDAREAIDNMDQAELYGRVIKCNQAKPQKDANEGLGSRTAIWEQVRPITRCCTCVSDEYSRMLQEGYAAKYNAPDEQMETDGDKPADPMQGLEELDVAGPRPQ